MLRCAFCHRYDGTSLVVRGGLMALTCRACPKASLVRCPSCRELLRADGEGACECRGCGEEYRVEGRTLVHLERAVQDAPAPEEVAPPAEPPVPVQPAPAHPAPAKPAPARRVEQRPPLPARRTERLEITEGAVGGGFRDPAGASVTIAQHLAARSAPESSPAGCGVAAAMIGWMGAVAGASVGVTFLVRDALPSAAAPLFFTAATVIFGIVPVFVLYSALYGHRTPRSTVRRLRIDGGDLHLEDGASAERVGALSQIAGVRAEKADVKWRVVLEVDGRDEVAFEWLEQEDAARTSEVIRRAVAPRREHE